MSKFFVVLFALAMVLGQFVIVPAASAEEQAPEVTVSLQFGEGGSSWTAAATPSRPARVGYLDVNGGYVTWRDVTITASPSGQFATTGGFLFTDQGRFDPWIQSVRNPRCIGAWAVDIQVTWNGSETLIQVENFGSTALEITTYGSDLQGVSVQQLATGESLSRLLPDGTAQIWAKIPGAGENCASFLFKGERVDPLPYKVRLPAINR